MAQTRLAEATRDKLMGVSLATLCTALFKRGLRRAGGAAAKRPTTARP